MLANYLHISQVRKGTTIPYISHILGVASIVLENGEEEDEVIAALLHDAAEDQGGEQILCRIKKEFGETVEKIVRNCTDTMENPKPEWKPRKEKFINGLKNASESAKLVILADKLHNARSILYDLRIDGCSLWGRFNASKEDIIWYYSEIVDEFKKMETKKIGNLINELDRVVHEIINIC